MNIVFVSKECPPSPHSSGIGSYVWETGSALAHFGHYVTIITASDDSGPASSTPTPRLTVVRLPDDELGTEKRSRLARVLRAPVEQVTAYRRRVAECIATVTGNGGADIIEFPGYRGESAVWLTGRRVLPMVARMHGLSAGINAGWRNHLYATNVLQMNWERMEFEAADVITAVSEHAAEPVRSKFGAGRVRVVRNSIDTEGWRKNSAKAAQDIATDDVLFVGRLHPAKGIFTLLRAARLLRRAGWPGRLILAGPTTPQFERYLRFRPTLRSRVGDWIVVLGTRPRERLAGLYRYAGVCCFPSLRDSFPYACLEAMACGGLVAGSLRTGMAEMLTEDCGILVPPGDVSALVKALSGALALSSGERARMKGAAIQRARDDFDHGVIIPELLNVYEETLSSFKLRFR